MVDLSGIFAQADKTKQDLLQVLAREWRAFLEALLADSTLEVNARIRLISPDKKGLKIKVVSKKTKLRKKKKSD